MLRSKLAGMFYSHIKRAKTGGKNLFTGMNYHRAVTHLHARSEKTFLRLTTKVTQLWKPRLHSLMKEIEANNTRLKNEMESIKATTFIQIPKDSRVKFHIETDFMPNYKNKERLVRANLKKLNLFNFSQKAFGHHDTSFLVPLTIYTQLLIDTGTDEGLVAASSLIRCATEYEKLNVPYLKEAAGDDMMRKIVKSLDEVAFTLVKSSGAERRFGILLQGITTSGGPRGWVKEKLISDCKNWVEGDPRWGKGKEDFIKGKLDRWTDQWFVNRRQPGNRPSFEQFVADPMKWATGGGAKKKTITHKQEDTSKTKWAWALACLANSGPSSMYAEAMKEENVAKVALKEESKTRMVITTPMASYLRQCYLLHVLGKPHFLKSTLTSQDYLEQMTQSTAYNYICIDASRFDQNFPKWFIVYILERFAKLAAEAGDTQVVNICTEEIAQLNSLKVSVMNKTFEYKNGLLSGWRITSLIGSMASAILCEYINSTLGVSMDYITQGDDIIMTSLQKRDPEVYTNICDEFGVDTHPDKCLFGEVGEFLKYTYTKDGIYGLPARGLRSLCYINPWLDANRERNLNEIALGWQTLLSRMYMVCPSERLVQNIVRLMVNDIHGWGSNKFIYTYDRSLPEPDRKKRVHLGKNKILNLLLTPLSLGGLGTFEMSGYADALSPVLEFETLTTLEPKDISADDAFMNAMGVLDSKNFRISTVSDKRLENPKRLMRNTLPLRKLEDVLPVSSLLGASDNFFATIVEMVCSVRPFPLAMRIKENYKKEGTNICKLALDKCKWPNRLKYTHRWIDILNWAMGQTFLSYPVSLFCDLRYSSRLLRIELDVTEAWYTSSVRLSKGDLWIATVYLHKVFSRTVGWLHSM